MKDSDILVPLKVFSERKKAPLGAIVLYLKEQKQLSFHRIAKILERNDRTIWTTYTRAKKENHLGISNTESISQKILQELQKYKLSKTELQQILFSPEEAVPASIFISSLTVLESTVKYLREEKGYSLHHIAEILERDEKNIWHSYHNAQKKMPSRFWVKDSDILVPLKVFSERKKAPLGAIVLYLKEQKQLSFHRIAKILERNDRTIWTTYTRAKKEHEKK
ncbi:hypothetical protein HZA98_01310 [Candidatus Woesearchaeota archaeon]|nr:hypothetical protein [Candidatus Woesearchaeota archaeon]